MRIWQSRVLLTGVALVMVIGLAAFFRLYDLQHYPPGLFPDEAANGEDVLLILSGDWRPFYARGNGREALFFYMQAFYVWWLGIGVLPMHLAAATVGILTVMATYFGTRVWFGRLAGVLAALFMATNHWHVTLSRTGFRAILMPLFIALFTAFVGHTIRAVKRDKETASFIYAALAGAAFAAGFYSYIAYRVMIGVVLGIFIIMLLAALHPNIGWPHLRRYGRQIVLAALMAMIVWVPLAFYFWQHPEAFVGRAGQVSVFNPDLQVKGGLWPTIVWSLKESAFAFFTGSGDLNWRHNVAGFALLSPLVAFLFLLGLVSAVNGTVSVVREIWRGQEIHLNMIYPYSLLVLAGLLVPVITTAEGIPHGLRSLGLAFPIFMLSGMAGAIILHWLSQRGWLIRSIGYGAAVGLIVLNIIHGGLLYFVVARHEPEAAYAYRGDLTEVSNYINQYRQEKANEPKPYVVLDTFSLQTVHYLTSVAAHDYQSHPDEELHPYYLLDPAKSHLTRLQPDEIIIFTQSTIPDADRYQKTATENGQVLEQIESRRNLYGQEVMRVYRPVGVEPVTGQESLDA